MRNILNYYGAKKLVLLLGNLSNLRVEKDSGNVFWNADIAPEHATKMHKIYKLGRRNIHRSGF